MDEHPMDDHRIDAAGSRRDRSALSLPRPVWIAVFVLATIVVVAGSIGFAYVVSQTGNSAAAGADPSGTFAFVLLLMLGAAAFGVVKVVRDNGLLARRRR